MICIMIHLIDISFLQYGHKKLIDIKQSHIMNMLNDMGDLSRSKEQVLLTTKQILNKAVENDYIIKNPAMRNKS